MILIKHWRVLIIALSVAIVFIVASILFLDVDNDGLNGFTELTLGTYLFNANTDGDNLNDSDEVNKYRTNPMNADTDGDGLDDYAEVMTYNTNPNDSDSNDDGFSDGYEVGIFGESDGLNDFDDENNTNSTDTDQDSEYLDDFNDENS